MINFIKRLLLIFTYPGELKEVLEEKRMKKIKQQRESERHNLNLCFKHRQEKNHSHFSEQNCDYCKLLRKIEKENECS